jgi:TIGR03009 family protein
MRYLFLALSGLLVWAAVAAAQQPPAQAPKAQPAPDPNAKKLDELLQRWEKEMKSVNTLSLDCTRTEKNNTFQYQDVFVGSAKYMKPNLAILEMKKKDKPAVFEKFICTGTFLYQYAPLQKEIRAHELAKKEGQVGNDNFLSFLFGMKAEEAKRRYDLKWVKEDKYYVYVQVLPRAVTDKADFQEARLVLNKDNCMPRQLWFRQPNGNEMTWDIPKIQPNIKLERTEFTAPSVPGGWKMVQVPKTTGSTPNVYRPKQ